MKKPFILFTLKVAVIVYFAACTGIDHYTTGQTATPIVTRGTWKIKFFESANNDQAGQYSGYSFIFHPDGILEASRDDISVRGKWFEDDISKKINIHFGLTDPTLTRLNSHWKIRQIDNGAIELQDTESSKNETLSIAVL
jgi:hypothetical protein